MLNKLFGTKLKERNIWTPRKVLNYLKQHPEIKTKAMLKQSSEQVYTAAYRLKIINDIFPEEKKRATTKWDKKTIKEFIKNNNIENKSQLYKLSKGAYCAAKRMNLFPILFDIEFEEPKEHIKGYCIYIYKFTELKAIYVGLTSNPKQRDR